MTLEEEKNASILLKRIKLTIEYGKHADEADIVDYINNVLNADGRRYMVESLNELDEMFNHAKP